ncbi:hypothetical protein HPB52_008781 [Rhipicephalus sanguineus]|uniref:HTH CENPB-type domain-containing protein n=1 Tax=Rhipicephalus sanguineus TaxID=34632 RepID=A0A9D4PWD5_RHISA|nr:hypothetical protein HPB52_008781 [Rhipicephalus sanguineus]
MHQVSEVHHEKPNNKEAVTDGGAHMLQCLVDGEENKRRDRRREYNRSPPGAATQTGFRGLSLAARASLAQLNNGKAKLRRKLSNGAPVFSEHVDNALFEYLERERSAGRAVSNRILSEEAVKIANSMQLGNFVASSHYINRWKQRAFRSSANSLRRRNGYTIYNMANMDQTMVRIDNPANRTNNVVGESTIGIANTGCARRGFMVCLAACATGHKLPAFIIFKEQSGKIPARAFASLHIPANVRHIATKNGWMTSEKMQEWLLRVWGPNVDNVRRLLVLDQAPIHKTQAATNAFKDTLQPADVYWNKPFQSTLRRLWEQYMREEVRTPKGNLKKPSRQHVLDFVAEAWAAVPEETVARSFKGCGISNALDGSEDGDLHRGLADVGAVVPEDRGGLQAECCDLFSAIDSEESFDGYTERRRAVKSVPLILGQHARVKLLGHVPKGTCSSSCPFAIVKCRHRHMNWTMATPVTVSVCRELLVCRKPWQKFQVIQMSSQSNARSKILAHAEVCLRCKQLLASAT